VQPSHKIRPAFDEANLVSSAGLVPALRLAEVAGLYVKQDRSGSSDQLMDSAAICLLLWFHRTRPTPAAECCGVGGPMP
jgi:hypothetical protein